MLPSHSSALKLSTVPPRPVSVNSSARIPSASTAASECPSAAYPRTLRSTTTAIPVHHDTIASSPPSVVVPTPDESLSPLDADMEMVVMDDPQTPRSPSRPELHFENLPVEIHEAILDHLFGERASMSTTTAAGKLSAGSWSKALRHPRRKALSNLSLIARVWRPLVQERIYRHIKIKGTIDGLLECAAWFRHHAHLAPYVRHVEVWVPVWGNRVARNPSRHQPVPRHVHEDGAVSVAALWQLTLGGADTNLNNGSNYQYHYSSRNATLEDIFEHVQMHFVEARILTLEGGHCKKPPMIQHFRSAPSGWARRDRLQVLPNIHTFVMRGAWNIMRDYQHWCTLAEALPALREWHCAYAKPKVEAFHTVSQILGNLSASLVHVNLSLEGFYSKEGTPSSWLGDKPEEPHLCRLIGGVAPRLESLAFTGKVCACLFQAARSAGTRAVGPTSLKSVDLSVKTCCREKPADPTLPLLDDASGITNLNFIRSFERLVVGAVHSLDVLRSLDRVRIRFIDLDSACPLFNPYFQMTHEQCSGLWSESILERLQAVRPAAQFVELSDGIYPQYGPNGQVVGAIYPRTRPRSIQASSYQIIADASKS